MSSRVADRLIASRLTGSGRGAVTTIGLHGNLEQIDSLFTPRNGRHVSGQPLNQIVFGHWTASGHSAVGEEVVLCRVAESQAELHCHGGTAALQRILSDLAAIGAEVVPVQEFLAQVTDDIEADCALVLSQAATRHTAKILLRQCELFPAELRQLRYLSTEERQQSVRDILAWQEFGLHLTRPWKVVLTGPPNAGKSTLLNALVGFERAIVFDQPGTTRDILTANTAFEGWPIQLIDTAGLRTTEDALEARGIQLARNELETADLIIALHAPDMEGFAVVSTNVTAPTLHVWNKLDQFPDLIPPTDHLAISAKLRQGLDMLIDRMLKLLIPRQPDDQQVIPCSLVQLRWLQVLS